MYLSRKGPSWIGTMAVLSAVVLLCSCVPPEGDPPPDDPGQNTGDPNGSGDPPAQNGGGSVVPPIGGGSSGGGLFGDPTASNQPAFEGELTVFGQGSVVADNPDPVGPDPQFRVSEDKCWIRSIFAVPSNTDVLFHAMPADGWAFAFWAEDAATAADAPSALVSFTGNRRVAAVFLPPLMASYRATWNLPSDDVEFLFFNDTDAELRTKLAIGDAFQQRDIVIPPFTWYRAVDNCPEHVFVGIPGGIKLYKDDPATTAVDPKEIVNFKNGVDLSRGADYECGETILLLLYVTAENQPKFCTSSIKMP